MPQEVSQKLGVRAFQSVEEVLASPEADAILIASSTPTYADLIERAVTAGKPMPYEKPNDLSLDRVDACAAAIRGTSVPIRLGFVRRFDPSHRAVRDTVRAGAIGATCTKSSSSRAIPAWPPSATSPSRAASSAT